MRNSIITSILFLSITGGSAWAQTLDGAPPPSGPPGDAAVALAQGNNTSALALADQELTTYPDDAWLLYTRGSALIELGRMDEGFVSLRRAEQMFPGTHEKSLAIYRRAMASENALHCEDAQREFAAYTAMIQGTEPDSAAMAMQYSNNCVQPTQIYSARHHNRQR